MQLFTILLQYYLLVVVVVSDIKVMSSTVAVIFAVINYLAITFVREPKTLPCALSQHHPLFCSVRYPKSLILVL